MSIPNFGIPDQYSVLLPKIPNLWILRCFRIFKKKSEKFSQFFFSGEFFIGKFGIFGIITEFSVLLPKIPNFGMKMQHWKKNQKKIWNFFFRNFFGHFGGYFFINFSEIVPVSGHFRYFGNTENTSNTVQYYWILKLFNTEFSILPNTKKSSNTEVQ